MSRHGRPRPPRTSHGPEPSGSPGIRGEDMGPFHERRPGNANRPDNGQRLSVLDDLTNKRRAQPRCPELQDKRRASGLELILSCDLAVWLLRESKGHGRNNRAGDLGHPYRCMLRAVSTCSKSRIYVGGRAKLPVGGQENSQQAH